MICPLKKLLATAALCALASCATQADESEFEDIVAVDVEPASVEAAPLAFGTPAAGELDRFTPFDFYSIETTYGDEARISAESPSGDALTLYLYLRVDGRWVYRTRVVNCDGTCLSGTFGGGTYGLLVTTTAYVRSGSRPQASYTLSVDCDGGPCAEPDGIECGGFGGIKCPDDMYCDYPEDLCGAANGPGVCKPRPEICTQEYRPVCGCGVNAIFSNACAAAAAGYDATACGFPPPGEFCGGPDDVQCGGGKQCDLSDNYTCGPDLTGQCGFKEAATCTTEFAPVCGCDGVLYTNDCQRSAAFVALDPTLEVVETPDGFVCQ